MAKCTKTKKNPSKSIDIDGFLNIVYNLDTTVKTVLYIVIYKQNAITFSRRVAVVYAFIPLD